MSDKTKIKGKEVKRDLSAGSDTRSESSYSDSSHASSTMPCDDDCELCSGRGQCRQAIYREELRHQWPRCRNCQGEGKVYVPYACHHGGSSGTSNAPGCGRCRHRIVCEPCGGRGTFSQWNMVQIVTGWRIADCPNRVPKKDPERRGRAQAKPLPKAGERSKDGSKK